MGVLSLYLIVTPYVGVTSWSVDRSGLTVPIVCLIFGLQVVSLSAAAALLSTPHNLGRRAGDRISPALSSYVFMQASSGAALIRLARHMGSLRFKLNFKHIIEPSHSTETRRPYPTREVITS